MKVGCSFLKASASPPQTRVLRGLSRPRHFDGHHAERSRRHGRSAAAYWWVSGNFEACFTVTAACVTSHLCCEEEEVDFIAADAQV